MCWLDYKGAFIIGLGNPGKPFVRLSGHAGTAEQDIFATCKIRKFGAQAICVHEIFTDLCAFHEQEISRISCLLLYSMQLIRPLNILSVLAGVYNFWPPPPPGNTITVKLKLMFYTIHWCLCYPLENLRSRIDFNSWIMCHWFPQCLPMKAIPHHIFHNLKSFLYGEELRINV